MPELESRNRTNHYRHETERELTHLATTPPSRIVGAMAGEVIQVRCHPRGDLIWLADVALGDHPAVQIVFGGAYKVKCGDLVPVALPGAQVIIRPPGLPEPRRKKIRKRRIRGELSHGMMCSLDELGWLIGGPDEVAVLQRLRPGDRLDDLRVDERQSVVVGWDRAYAMMLASMVTSSAPRSARPATSA